MVEVQLFLEGLFATVGALVGDFVTSVGGFIGGLASGIRDVLNGLSISK